MTASTGFRPRNATAATLCVVRHTTISTAASARAAISWKYSRATSGDGPAIQAPSVATPTKTGPYTDARCAQRGLTRAENGSWGKSAGVCS